MMAVASCCKFSHGSKYQQLKVICCHSPLGCRISLPSKMQAKEVNEFTSLQSSTTPEWSPNFPLQAALQGKIKTYDNDIPYT